MPKYKYFGIIILTKIQNKLCGMDLSEFHSGYRAYEVSLLNHIPFWENSDEWHFDTEIILQANKINSKIYEVSIPTYYGTEICHVNGIVYGLNCILSSIKYYLHNKGIFYNRRFDLKLEGSQYQEKFNNPYSCHSLILKRLKLENVERKRVLEIGIRDTSITKKLYELSSIVDAIEINPLYADLARSFCQRVIIDDLDGIDKMKLVEKYDVVIAADILEHLKDPEKVLSHLKKVLKRNGLLIVSLPNVANIYVRLNLAFGRFPYHTKGILDKTHLHFYTLATANKMLLKTGWVITGKDVTTIPIAIVFPFLQRRPFNILLSLFNFLTCLMKGLFAYQGIYYCINPNEPDLL